MQIKTSRRCDYTLIGMAKINTTRCWWCGAIGIFIHFWWWCKTVQPLWKTPSFYKTKYALTLRAKNHAPWYLQKGTECSCPHKKLYKNVFSRFTYNCQNLTAITMSFNRWGLSHFSHVQLFATLWNVGSSVHGTLQARVLEWVAISSSKGSSPPQDQTRISFVSCIGRQVLYCEHHPGSPFN